MGKKPTTKQPKLCFPKKEGLSLFHFTLRKMRVREEQARFDKLQKPQATRKYDLTQCNSKRLIKHDVLVKEALSGCCTTKFQLN